MKFYIKPMYIIAEKEVGLLNAKKICASISLKKAQEKLKEMYYDVIKNDKDIECSSIYKNYYTYSKNNKSFKGIIYKASNLEIM